MSDMVHYEGLEDDDVFVGDLEKLAGDLNSSLDVLEKLAGHHDFWVRFYVAYNSNSSLEILEKLSGDEDYLVRYWVAGNPSTSVEILKKLSNDENVEVRYHAIESLRVKDAL